MLSGNPRQAPPAIAWVRRQVPRHCHRSQPPTSGRGRGEHPMLGLHPPDVLQIAQRLRQSPGFIAFGGRYLYVTPILIAQVAFQSAWERWVAPDPPGFLRALPEPLIEPFVARVQSAG